MHLIVMVHGMWGNVHHFDYLKDQLVAHGATSHDGGDLPFEIGNVLVYRTSSNEGYFTYDGVDVCGLRVAEEIQNEVELLSRSGHKVTEISLMGYSMGGVIVRYAAGILETRHFFDNLKCKTFTTMFTPHLGVRVLRPGVGSTLFNVIGSYSMARTSQQVFLVDSHHNWHAPLFLHMTSRDTPYFAALSRFEQRALYANIVNDRRCEFYTASAQTQLRARGEPTGTPLPGYEPVLYSEFEPKLSTPPAAQGVFARALSYLGLAFRVGVGVPLWFCAFLINAAYQTAASALRTSPILRSGRLLTVDEQSSNDLQHLLEREANALVEEVYSTVDTHPTDPSPPAEVKLIERQFNELEWRRVYVHITLDKNAHAAAIVRQNKPSMAEGKVVVRHWLKEVLQL